MDNEAIMVMVTAATPLIELRGSIPLGLALGLPLGTVWVLSIIGNVIPVPFILLGIGWLLSVVKHVPRVEAFIHRKAEKSSQKLQPTIQRWGWLGLLLFVAIPLPGTGAWTGALAATVLNMRFWPSLLAIIAGITLASFLVSGIGVGVMSIL